ncbi:MAG: hypothetical protein KDD04_04945, partial [Sinomicrobium sp.]|nr:hypothetical protein [Sinomicrobium sp.]
MKNPEDCYAKMKFLLQRELPFAAWRQPGANFINLVFQEDDTANYVNDYSESGFVFAPFQSEKKALFISSECYASCNAPGNATSTPGPVTTAGTLSGKAMHLQRVSKGIEAIEKGLFKKVVLSRSESVAVSDPDQIRRFGKLLS